MALLPLSSEMMILSGISISFPWTEPSSLISWNKCVSYAVAIGSCLKMWLNLLVTQLRNDEYDLSIVLQQKICVFNFPFFIFHDQCSPQIYKNKSKETLEIYIYMSHIDKVKGKPQQTLSSWDRWHVQKLHAGPGPIVSKPDANDGNRFYGDE